LKSLREIREAAGLSQFALAHRAGISRMRLQLAESEHVTLRSEEIEALNRALRGAIERRVAILQGALSSTGACGAHA
jgi:transcriptional regulator with XRE-family HTH domain